MGWPNNFVQGVYNALGSLIGVSDGAGGEIGLTPTYTWATKPLASAYTGRAFISDIGGGSIWYSNGTYWKPINGFVTLAYQNSGFSLVTNTGADTTVFTYNAPAGLLGLNGTYQISGRFTAIDAGANAKYFNFLLGASVLCSAPMSATGTNAIHAVQKIQNRNSESVQIGDNAVLNYTTTTGGFSVGAVDTSAAHTLTYNVHCPVGATSIQPETIRLDLYIP